MSPFDNMWIDLGIPIDAVALALIAYGIAVVGARRLDRKYSRR